MQEEKKKILQLVQDGKITVEEAMKILEELEKASEQSEKKEQVLMTELSTVVVDQEEPASHQDPFHKKLQSSKEKIFDFVESAFKKLKETDLDFNFGTSYDFTHIFQHNNAVFNEIEIEIANGKTKIVPWDQHEVRVEAQVKVYQGESQNEAKEFFLKESLFSIEDGKLRFHIVRKSIKAEVVIYIPKTSYHELNIRMFNGSITGENLEVENIKAKTANGSISMEGTKGKKVDVETGNGSIVISRTNTEKVEAESLNGSISVEGIYKKLDTQTFSGSVTARIEDPLCEMVSARSTTGKLQLFIPVGIPVAGELKSNLGSFNVSLEGIQIIEEKSDVIQKILTFKTIKTEVPSLQLIADSKTGSITVS
jgi:DUF4097 and DUF4098 domain-containing protein YvlB